METSLAIVACRCEVAGVPAESIDLRVRYFTSLSESEIDVFLRSEPTHSYANDAGEIVSWPLVGLLAVEPFENPSSGKEIVGCITDCNEFVKWARNERDT